MARLANLWVRNLLLTALAYVMVTSVLFGGPFQPIALATVWSNRLGVPDWRLIATVGVAALGLIFVIPLRNPIAALLRPPIFVTLAVLLPTVIVGLYADGVRHRAVLAFGADEVVEHSIFQSFHAAPEEFQFFLHTAALKGCKPFAWSYRTMSFYPLGLDVAGNVVPYSWIKRCKLEISNN